MRIRVEEDQARGRYEVFADDRRAGYTSYRREGGLIAFDHTAIDERFEGEGVGSAMVRKVLDQAREAGLEVLPFCPFVNDWVIRHPEYADLVPADRRERFGLSETPRPD